jgi:hypothetical protein
VPNEPLVASRCGQLLTGIALVHGREGWFVVSGGRNGVEFSVMPLIVLFAIFCRDVWWSKRTS